MAECGKGRGDAPGLPVLTRPVPMQLFATWEVERTSPNCVPRLCVLKVTRLEVVKLLELNLTEVVISVSMQSSRKILRSNEIVVRPSGLIDAELNLSFSLQYPHFLKRAGNNLRVMLQRRKKYKNRTILGFKTLAVGLVNMGQVLQCSVDNELKLYAKGSSDPVARVTVSSLTSQPVEADTERMSGSVNRSAGDRGDVEDNSSDEDDDFSMSEGSDSGDPDILDDEQRRTGKMIPDKQKNFKQKFIALLKKFKVADEELVGEISNYPDIDMSQPGNEANDDFMFPDDLDDLDSDAENELLEDAISIISTPKPCLRPFFDVRNSTENMQQSKTPNGDMYEPQPSQTPGAESEDVSSEAENLMDNLSPSSDADVLSDSTPGQDSSTANSPVVKRSLSLKERRKESVISAEDRQRRRSDELQLPAYSLNEQLNNVLPLDDTIPDSILLISTADWQGQFLALRLWDKCTQMICARTSADTQAVFLAIVNKYQKFCNSHSHSPPHLRVAIAGTEGFVSTVLQPYVEQFSSKPSEWQTFLTFLHIPLGSQPLAKYIAAMDSTYNSLFMDSFWKEAFEHSDAPLDVDEVQRRVEKFMSATTLTYALPIAEALINTKYTGSDERSSQVFVPFVCDVRIASTEGFQDYEATVTSGAPTSVTSLSATGSSPRGEAQGPAAPGSSPLLQSPFLPPGRDATSPSTDLLELQVDYWLTAGNKREATKSSLKTTFRSLVVSRLPSSEEPSALTVTAVTKERRRGPKLEAMMRSMKKSKEKDAESKHQPVVASVSKLVCTTKAQSSTLNVIIDGVTWSEVKFFSLSSQWPTHIKYFPIGVFARAETSC